MIDAIAPTAPGASLGIRWPNDVEVDGRKLGGILPERVMTPRGPRILIGIGLNVATRMGDAPAEVGRMAVALTQLRETPLTLDDLESLLRAILDRFGAILPRLAGDDPRLSERWDRLDTLRDQRVRVDLGPRIVAGIGARDRRRGGALPGRRSGDGPDRRRQGPPRTGLRNGTGVTYRHVTPVPDRGPRLRGQRAVASALSRPTPVGGFWFVQSIRIGVAM